MLTNPKLKSQVNALWDRFWSGGISNPLDSIQQMSYLIFLKRLEDIDNAKATSAKRRKQDYTSIFNKEYEKVSPMQAQKCRWSYWSQLPGHDMLPFVRDTVFEFLRGLGTDTSAFATHMKDATFIIDKPSLLQEAVSIIEDMHISEQNADVQGDLYEYLLGELATAGKNGQFRTPRHIIRMMVELMDPKVGELICDPACGSSGFLVAAYEHILLQNTSKNIIEWDEEGKAHNLVGDKITEPKVHRFLKSKAFNGYDNDRSMVRIGAMNLMLHGIDEPNIQRADTLSKSFNEKNKYQLILANPPFKGSIDGSDVNERFSLKTKKTELLFVELIYQMLDSGGRAAVIVPDGVMFGNSNAHVDTRKLLIENCSLDGVISMPSGVFKPYAGVSTSILLFTKGGTTTNVWFYNMTADGYSLDDKRTKTEANNIPDIIAKWQARSGVLSGAEGRTTNTFTVPRAEIEANNYDLSFSKYKQEVYEEVKYQSPKAIFKQLETLEKEISKGLSELKERI